jgi:hypothetical protein
MAWESYCPCLFLSPSYMIAPKYKGAIIFGNFPTISGFLVEEGKWAFKN